MVVGHDWGSNVAATFALLFPGVFRAVALPSVPYAPPGSPCPSGFLGQIGGLEQDFYVSYFQKPGRTESLTCGAGPRASTPFSPAALCPLKASPTRTSSPTVASCMSAFPSASSHSG